MQRLLLVTIALLLAAGIAVGRQRVVDEVDLFAVRTGSMGDAAPIGSLVAVRPAPIAVGDVVTYDLQNGTVVTHRVAEILPNGKLVTKGDANELPDPWEVDPSVVRGVVQRVYDRGGYVLTYLTLPVGLASIAAAGITLRCAWRLCFPKARRSPPEPVVVDEPSAPPPRAAGRRLAAAAVVVVAAVVSLAGPAGATPDLTRCGPPVAVVVDDLLPGDTQGADVDVCNEGTSPGVLAAVVDAGALADLFTVTFDGEGEVLGPGERRTFRVEVGLDAGVGNEWANRTVPVDFVLTLTATEPAAGGAGERPAPPVGPAPPGGTGVLGGAGARDPATGDTGGGGVVRVPVVGRGALSRTGVDVAVPIVAAGALAVAGGWLLLASRPHRGA